MAGTKSGNGMLILLLRSGLFLFLLLGVFPTRGYPFHLEKVTTHPAVDYFPAPSSDGRYLAFVSERSGNPDIWLQSLTEGVIALPRQLTSHPSVDRDPALNRDGSRLLYVSHKRDPRGDIYLMDVITGEETQLTDLASGDSLPQWGPDEQSMYYLRHDIASGERSVVKHELAGGVEQVVVKQAAAFSVGPKGWIVFSNGGPLQLLTSADSEVPVSLTTERYVDFSPGFPSSATVDNEKVWVYFTRYEEDSNRDGVVDTDDESSIWMGLLDEPPITFRQRYRLTPSREFHLYPAEAKGFIYFSDLKKGDIYRLDHQEFLENYQTFEKARALAIELGDKGETAEELMVLANVSKNLAPALSVESRAEFDFSYAEKLMADGNFPVAHEILTPYVKDEGKIGALAEIHSVVLDVLQTKEQLSVAGFKRIVASRVKQLMEVGQRFRSDDVIFGQALIEAGHLYHLAGDSLSALDYLVRVEDLHNADMKAKALFMRAMVYRGLGDESSLRKVFIDVIKMFGEDSSWGRRAVTQAIMVSEQGGDVHQQVASLHTLINEHAELPYLKASARLRIADLYDEQGEQIKAVQALDQILTEPPPYPELVERTYRRKAEILSDSERYQEAAEAYAALVKLTGKNQQDLDRARSLMVQQLVKKALKDRSIGEVRIAAKAFKQIAEDYPESVQAHRDYIETKVMLKETAEVQGWYRDLLVAHPNHPVYLYSDALAMSYSEPPDFSTIISLVKRAIALDSSVSYFHQTLGWAYEQEERINGKKGFLEKAEGEYRLALLLNDDFQYPDVEANLLLNLGNTYMALNNFHEAYRHYQQRERLQVVTVNPATELLFRKNYGEACFKAGNSQEAIIQYRKALQRVPDSNPSLHAELLERIGLAQQDLGQYSDAVQAFSEAMEINLASGNNKNLALLQRNIGVNLYNLSTRERDGTREPLKKALTSYFASLENLKRIGGKEQKKGEGFFNLAVSLGGTGSQAATGFDRQGEEKLIFSYIAGTYEKLGEPGPARDYYLKKLGLLSGGPSAETDVARGTEKAIVLNRVALLSHQLGLTAEAIEYMRQSLHLTQKLKLSYGTGVNLYNLARLASQQWQEGEPVDWLLVDQLVKGLDERMAGGHKDAQTFYALTAGAFLLHQLSPDSMAKHEKPEDAVQHVHNLVTYKSRVWPYYTKALELLEQEKVLSPEWAVPQVMAVKVNMMEVAAQAGRESIYHHLQKELEELIHTSSSPNAWVGLLSQAELNETKESQRDWLQQAFDRLMVLPPQAYPQGQSPRGSAFDRLGILFVDLLVDDKNFGQALIMADQIERRKLATLLYEQVGEDLFLQGLGDYQGELKNRFSDIRAKLDALPLEDIQKRSAQLEELWYGLYEEFPWAVSSFWQYPLSADVVSQVLSPEQPYLKIIQGRDRWHGFLHDGKETTYLSLRSNNGQLEEKEQLHRMLSNRVSCYVSLPEGQAREWERWLRETIPEIPFVHVSSLYDILDGYHQRSLFYANVVITGDFSLSPQLTAGDVRLSTHVLQGNPEHSSALLKNAQVFIANGPRNGFAVEVSRELGVRETVFVPNLVGTTRHTAFMLNNGDGGGQLDTKLLVYALLRAGFSHVIMNVAAYNRESAQRFVSLYLAYLGDLPAADAVAFSAKEVFGGKPSSYRLYGYAGMNEEERTKFASSRYTEELNSAVSLYQKEAFPEALQKMENALSVIHYANKEGDIKDLTKLAVDASFKIGDYQKAVFHQQKLLEILGESASVEERSEALYRLGILYSRLERFDVAIEQLQQAIDLWTQADELDRLAEGMATLGVVRENMGAYSEALKDFGRSFDLYQEMGEIGDMAAQYRRIGRIYYLRLGRYEQAREKFLAALESYRQVKDRQGEAEILFEIGLTYEKMALFTEADQQYRAGKQIGEELGNAFLLATGDLYLANTAWFRGEYQDAFQSLSRAEKHAEEAGDAQLHIMVNNTRGLIYWTLNDTDKGLVHLKQAVALAEQADIKTELASSLNNLGLIYRQRGEYVTSLENFEKAKHIDEDLKSRWGLGYDYRNIGMAQLKLGKLLEAEKNFLEAERTSAEIKNAINWVKALLELGNVNQALNKPDQAMTYFQQAYELSKRYGIKEVEWRAAGGIASLLRAQGKPEEAFSWYAKAVTVVENMRASLKIDELRNSFQGNKLDLYRDTISLLIDMKRTEEAFNYLERSRSRSFIDLLGNQKLTLKNEADQKSLDHIAALSKRVEALNREVGSYDKPPAEIQERYQETKALYDEALIELKQRNPGLNSFVSVDPLTQKDVQQLLEPGVGLLSFMVSKGKTYIWMLKQTGVTFYEVPVGEEELGNLVTRYRNSVQHLEPVDEELRQLDKFLIAPVQSELTGVEYLGLIPDGPLHFLSFSALKHDGGYLIDQVPLFYTPSASVLKFTFAKRGQQKNVKVLAVGNPDLGNYNYDLPLAELEAKSIRWDYPDMDILTGPKATKEWFVANIGRYGIIHLAAHGEFDAINPLLSSLWLASKQPDNRQLTVQEIFGLEIHADLVTLSACQTGLGKLEAGELIGLNRAFIYAGTHALISALWRVDDLSTSVLMKHFYRNYVTMNKARSLRQAQLIVKKDFPHPSYWAGFSLVGDYQ